MKYVQSLVNTKGKLPVFEIEVQVVHSRTFKVRAENIEEARSLAKSANCANDWSEDEKDAKMTYIDGVENRKIKSYQHAYIVCASPEFGNTVCPSYEEGGENDGNI